MVRVGTALKYAAIQEFGGVITAQGKALTVPIHRDARRASEQGQSVREAFGDTLAFIKRKGKPPLLVRPEGFDVMYVLVKSVTLPPRPYFRPTLAKQKEPMNKVFAKAAARQWKKAA